MTDKTWLLERCKVIRKKDVYGGQGDKEAIASPRKAGMDLLLSSDQLESRGNVSGRIKRRLALAIGTVHDKKTTTNPHAPNYKAAVESPSVGNVGRTSQNYNHNGRLTWGRNREGTDNVNNPVTKLVSSS